MSATISSYQTHRRDNPSISSSSSKADRNGRSNHPAVESAVTRLLVSIKELLEALTKWSQQEVTDMDVSDVYVRLGNDFNAAVAAFTAFRIEMTELLSVPEDLRNVLETCLAEDARPESLDRFLPDVRKIITNLLQGLRGKQTIYRRLVSEHRHRSDSTSHARTDSKSSVRSVPDRTRRDTSGSQRIMNSRRDAEYPRTLDSQSLRKTAATSSRRKEPSGMQQMASPPRPPLVEDEEQFVGGFVLPESHSSPMDPSFNSPEGSYTPPPSYYPAGLGSPERSSTPPVVPLPSNGHSPSPSVETFGVNGASHTPAVVAPVPTLPKVPPGVRRYSLVDKPMGAPSVVVDDAFPSPPREGFPLERAGSPSVDSSSIETTASPAINSSLAALKQSETLERRASKRFSHYNISKITGSIRSGGTQNANRRSMVASGPLTAGELAVLTEADEEEGPITPRKRERATRRNHSSTIAEQEEPIPPVPPLPPKDSHSPELPPLETPSTAAIPFSAMDKPFPVFLQVGREVKKAIIDSSLTLSTLRMLFVDKFSYSPGLENFPSIYIRDASSGIQYELEDIEEMTEKCLLSLNIEPLDQIKQHIDIQITSLSRDIKDLRSFVSNNRTSIPFASTVAQPFDETVMPSTRPTDRQLQKAAGRLSKLWADGAPSTKAEDGERQTTDPVASQITGQSVQPQVTGNSVILSDFSNRIVGDLRTQFDEVQNLRRDLGVMRQLYTEFMKQTKESLGTLRSQAHNVRQLAKTKVSGSRAYIQDGKQKLDTRSQNVLTKMEEIQDTVEGVKDDVVKRHISPKPHVLKAVQEDINSLEKQLESLKEHIQTVKPVWKKTWEEELQLIVEEQQFLSHQEEFLSDLQDDHKAVLEIYGHVEKVISLRGTGGSRGGRSRGFGSRPLPAEGVESIPTVMAEIRAAAVDPERRMKAIAANQKSREKDIATKSDEFQSELTGFVGGKKLKMTGGAEEVERVRQRRNDQTLKAMFSSPPVQSAFPPLPLSPTDSSVDLTTHQ